MGSKQEASRIAAGSAVGPPLQAGLMAASGSANCDEKTIGPRGDRTCPASDPEEFQPYGQSRATDDPERDSLSPWVDPLQRVLAHSTPAPESVTPHPVNPAPALELWRAVRRIAWGGDRQRSVAYIELGAGELNGAAVTLEARGRAISLVLELPPGVASAGWAQRLAERLARRGLEVESVEVR